MPIPVCELSTRELVQLLMEFHGAGLDRALEIVAKTGDSGLRLIDELGRDPLVSSLLVLYGLHPDDLETRVKKAVEQVRPKLQRNGGEVELLGTEDGTVRLRMGLTGHSCASTGATLQSTVEEAIYEAAPDVASIVVEGLEGKPAEGFVSLDKLLGSHSQLSGVTSQSLGMEIKVRRAKKMQPSCRRCVDHGCTRIPGLRERIWYASPVCAAATECRAL